MFGFRRALVFSTAPDKEPVHPGSTSAWWDCRLFSPFTSYSHLIFFGHDNLQNPSSSISGVPGPDQNGDRETAHSDPALLTHSGSQEKDSSPKEECGERETGGGKEEGSRM